MPARTALAVESRHIPYVISCTETTRLAVWKLLETITKRSLGGQEEIDLPQHCTAIGDLPNEAIFRRCDIRGQFPLKTCFEEVTESLECGVHFCAGKSLQFSAAFEIRDK